MVLTCKHMVTLCNSLIIRILYRRVDRKTARKSILILTFPFQSPRVSSFVGRRTFASVTRSFNYSALLSFLKRWREETLTIVYLFVSLFKFLSFILFSFFPFFLFNNFLFPFPFSLFLFCIKLQETYILLLYFIMIQI